MLDPDSVVVETADHLGVRAGAVLIWVTRRQLDSAVLDQLRDALADLALDHPQGVALLAIAVGESELPTLQTRRRIVGGLAALGDRLQAVAAVFEGEHRWLTIARSTFEGIFAQAEAALIGGRFPMRAFGDRGEAVEWTGEVVRGSDGRPIDVEALMDQVDLACARLTGSKSEP